MLQEKREVGEKMNAFKVFYSTGGKVDSMVVLVNDEDDIEQAIANKDKDFKSGGRWSKITFKEKLSLYNVRVLELSVAELLNLLGKVK